MGLVYAKEFVLAELAHAADFILSLTELVSEAVDWARA